jgi:hypothetical protein
MHEDKPEGYRCLARVTGSSASQQQPFVGPGRPGPHVDPDRPHVKRSRDRVTIVIACCPNQPLRRGA